MSNYRWFLAVLICQPVTIVASQYSTVVRCVLDLTDDHDGSNGEDYSFEIGREWSWRRRWKTNCTNFGIVMGYASTKAGAVERMFVEYVWGA
jgi:hypothetical protein